jgi:chlorite dismutase
METTGRRWVRFFAATGAAFDPGAGAYVNRYEVRRLVSVAGGPRLDLRTRSGYMRVETPTPWSAAATHAYHGVTEHLHYTTAAQARLLDRDAVAELAPSESTIAVLIPMKKSDAWWRLAQDERNTYFQRSHALEGHTEIGLRLANRVYRRLYHCRALGEPFDFLTYFEFDQAHEPDFKELLRRLRDVKTNPEWSFVTDEFEIWMTKVAVTRR